MDSVQYIFLAMKRVTIIPRKNAMFRLKIKGYEFPTFLIFKKIIQFYSRSRTSLFYVFVTK